MRALAPLFVLVALLTVVAGGAVTLPPGSPLSSISPVAGGEFGYDVAAADVNGDAVPDLVVGAPGEGLGAVHVRFGPAYGASVSAGAPGGGGRFAQAVAAGDIDGDGYDDVIAGSYLANVGSLIGAGEAWVLFGPDLTRTQRITAPSPQGAAAFGISVAAGDLNGDAHADVVAGAWDNNVPPYTKAGRAYVFYGPSLAPGPSLQSPAPQNVADFGVATAIADYDGDGSGDVVVGSWLADVAGRVDAGQVFVLPGPLFALPVALSDGPLLTRRLGLSLAAADLDGDGAAEIVAGAEGETLIFSHDAPPVRRAVPAAWLANAVSVAAGDANGDGAADVALGAARAPFEPPTGRGAGVAVVPDPALHLSPPVPGAGYGASVALLPGTLAVGAPLDDAAASDAGAVYLVPLAADADADGWIDPADNCPATPNTEQTNSDARIDLSPQKTYDDVTVVMSDPLGDACDADDDNDGLSDTDELNGYACATTDPARAATDGDHALDFAECALGTEPLDLAREPSSAACGAATDPDGDRILSYREACYYGSDPMVADSDDDGIDDGCEAYSINGDSAVNVLDLQQVAAERVSGYAIPASAVRYDFDVTKNGSIDVIDLQQVASAIAPCG